MRPSLRFLLVATVGWAGIRAASAGILPGAELFRIERSEAKPPPIVPTQFPAIEPVPAAGAGMPAMPFLPAAFPQTQVIVRPVPMPIYIGASSTPPNGAIGRVLPTPQPLFYAPTPALDEWPLSRLAAASSTPFRSSVVIAAQSTPAAAQPRPLDRLQLSAWAMLRKQQGGIAGSNSLASGGQLGGSQAGARLAYNFTRQIAATMRFTSPVGRRGVELAAGVRVQPVGGIPIWLTAERRQRIGRFGAGRNAFAVFAEGGVYDRPLPARFVLDAYVQGGAVGLHHRDLFVDGGLAVTRPLFRNFSAGFGLWGGAQPHVYRIDAGPRLTMRVRSNIKVHADWRQRLAGNARPGSGPALTLATDF